MTKKKPFYTRWWFYAIIAFVIIGVIFSPSDEERAELDAEKEVQVATFKEDQAEKKQAEEKVEVVAEPASTTGRDEEIRNIIEDIHADKYIGSEIVEIEVNENLGLNDGSYVVLAHFSFTRPNSAEKTLNFTSKYSEDLAASLAKTKDVSAVTVFYEAPRFVESGKNATKFAYNRSGTKMVLDNEFIAPELQ